MKIDLPHSLLRKIQNLTPSLRHHAKAERFSRKILSVVFINSSWKITIQIRHVNGDISTGKADARAGKIGLLSWKLDSITGKLNTREIQVKNADICTRKAQKKFIDYSFAENIPQWDFVLWMRKRFNLMNELQHCNKMKKMKFFYER